MTDVLNLLEKVGLKRLRAAIRQTPLGRGGRDQVIRVETVIKIGSPDALKGEYYTYMHFARFLKEEERHLLFPRIALSLASSKRAVLAIEPIFGSTFEKVIFRIIGLARRHGWESREVCAHQKLIRRITRKVLAKLAILHRPIRAKRRKAEVVSFIRELICGLAESVRRAKIPWDPASLYQKAEGVEEAIVCMAHRDLGLINIITDGENAFFIDPRPHVVSTLGNRRGARFASPAIDLAAFLVGLERSELEIRRIQPSFRLSAKQCVMQEIRRRQRKKQISPLLLLLSEAAVWAGYAACQCNQCLDPRRAWLRRCVIACTRQYLTQLSRLK